MSTVLEIESAIKRLPSREIARLAAWLEEFRQQEIVPSEGQQHHDLDEFIGTWRKDAAFDAAQGVFGQVDEALWK